MESKLSYHSQLDLESVYSPIERLHILIKHGNPDIVANLIFQELPDFSDEDLKLAVATAAANEVNFIKSYGGDKNGGDWFKSKEKKMKQISRTKKTGRALRDLIKSTYI